MSTFEGLLEARGLRFGIVVSRFNEFITRRLLDAAQRELFQHGAEQDRIDVVWVPGAFEVTLACRKLVETGRVEAVLALACVIRGETPHFDYVAHALTQGILKIALDDDVPIIFGALICDTLEQAIQRAGGKMGNKGAEAARAAIEMANLSRALGAQHPDVRSRIRVLNANA